MPSVHEALGAKIKLATFRNSQQCDFFSVFLRFNLLTPEAVKESAFHGLDKLQVLDIESHLALPKVTKQKKEKETENDEDEEEEEEEDR